MVIRAVTLIYFTCIALLAVCHVSCDDVDYFYPNDKNCGKTKDIPWDTRTSSPWTVAIFVRKHLRSPFHFFLTGSLGGPTTVLTTFGGSYGQPSYKNTTQRRYHIPSPRHFLVVAGIRSTDLNDMDEFSQMANVSYILPYNGNMSGSEEYHLVMFRLETPFKLDTPYARSICQPYGVVPALHDFGYKGRYSDILTHERNIEPTFMSGFGGPIKEDGPRKIMRLSATASNDAGCLNTYKYYYRSQPDEIFCLIINPDEGVRETTCMSHGSLMVFKPKSVTVANSKFFHPEPRFYSSGFISLIPRRDRGQCDIRTVYVAQSLLTSSLDWIKLNIICNSTTYPCHDGKCVPLDQVCDGKEDCSSGEDEDPVYCNATNRCKETDAYQCGLEGKCIRGAQVGDGVNHCPSGSDEHPEVVQTKRIGRNKTISGESVFCEPLNVPQGADATCSHPQLGEVDCSKSPGDTEMTMKCAKYFRPSSRINRMTMKCSDDKSWKPFRAFACQPECGLVHKRKSDVTPNSPTLFPWHGEILRETEDGRMEIICGASLVEQNILITAAHCTMDSNGLPYEARDLKVLLKPNGVITEEGEEKKDTAFHQVGEVIRPLDYDADSAQSDIAIIKLKTPVTFTDSVKPICYLMHEFPHAPRPNSTGTVHKSEEIMYGQNLAEVRNLDFVVLPENRCDVISGDSFCAKFSQGGVPCSGFGGAGLVFPVDSDQDMVTYVLKGVFQKEENQVGCEQDSEKIYRLTHLDAHSQWILLNLQNIAHTDI